MMKKNESCRHHHSSGLRFPIFLILIGLVILAGNTGMLPTIQPLFSSWPIWLFLGGILFLTSCSWFMGLSLVSVGAFFMIPQIGEMNPGLNIPPDFAHVYWPVLLVLGGVYVALGHLFKPKWNSCGKHFHHDFDSYTSTLKSEDGMVQVSTSFDSRKHIVLDPIFKGGSLDCSFGEVVLDLRKTDLQEGKTTLKVNVAFGSAQIIVPSTWNVQMHGDSMFAAFNDSRFSPYFNPNDDRTLIIEGKCAFGECKLRD